MALSAVCKSKKGKETHFHDATCAVWHVTCAVWLHSCGIKHKLVAIQCASAVLEVSLRQGEHDTCILAGKRDDPYSFCFCIWKIAHRPLHTLFPHLVLWHNTGPFHTLIAHSAIRHTGPYIPYCILLTLP